MSEPIYLDNNATTRIDSRVLDVMLPFLRESYGNAASTHPLGYQAKSAVNQARTQISTCLGCQPNEVVYTSGATESDNLAIKGVAMALKSKGNHIITACTEHKAVLDSCAALEQWGFRITNLSVDPDGLISIADLQQAICSETILVSIMAGNNEIGTLQDIAAIGELCRNRGVLFHTDATQAIGKIPFDVNALNVDLASFTAHKIYGPKGAGGLYVRYGTPLTPLIHGGGHEGGMRSGTLNVPGIVGLGHCIELCQQELSSEQARLVGLRERLLLGMRTFAAVTVNGHLHQRLPGHLSLSLKGVNANELLSRTSNVIASTISACSSGGHSVSHVLAGIGCSEERVAGTIRFGIGRFNTEEEIDSAVASLSRNCALMS